MRKKYWFIGIVVLMAAVIGLGSATALAQESDGETSRLGIIARVANILGLEEQQVQDAFDQARQELRDEHLKRWSAKGWTRWSRVAASPKSRPMNSVSGTRNDRTLSGSPVVLLAAGRMAGITAASLVAAASITARASAVKKIMGETFRGDSFNSEISLLTRKNRPGNSHDYTGTGNACEHTGCNSYGPGRQLQ